MRNVKWLTFGVSNSVARTVVHFFPSGGGVTAPYPSNCALTVFGPLSGQMGAGTPAGIARKVVIEGARLSQPDGVRLEQAFSELAEGLNGFFGLSVELSTAQPRIDLSASECVIELRSRGNSVRFWPKMVKDSEEKETEGSSPSPVAMACLKDAYLSSSLLVINESEDPFNPECFICDYSEAEKEAATEEEDKSFRRIVETGYVPPLSVMEFPLSDSILTAAGAKDDGGETDSAAVYCGAQRAGTSCYALYRDVVTKRPVSVSAL